jgi:hypothetical protein
MLYCGNAQQKGEVTVRCRSAAFGLGLMAGAGLGSQIYAISVSDVLIAGIVDAGG